MNLLNLVPDAAQAAVDDLVRTEEWPRYRARQIVERLWTRPVGAWDEATDLPREVRRRLETWSPLPSLPLANRQDSRDGTVKLLWTLPDGLAVESVWIPEGRRTTLCISSQAGCAYGCVFCATGRMGFQRHLEPWEIVGQVRALIRDPTLGTPTHLVFMGMGEPLHNWAGVDTALTILNAPNGAGIGARRITVSTIGLLPALRKFAARPEQFRLAVSLHAPTSARRAALMPVERKYPLAALRRELTQFRKRITLEYVMIAEANDTAADARDLAQIATELRAMVNLLPLHPGGGGGLRPSSPATIQRFAKTLRTAGVNVNVRRSRGLDISAACGQLRIESSPV